MAYLLVAAGVLLRQEIHERKELQREKKRLAYEQWYRELEQEHADRISSVSQQVMAGPDSGSIGPWRENSAVSGGDVQRRNDIEDSGRRGSEDNLHDGLTGTGDRVVRERAHVTIT
ncbi:uncharacterized protein Z519_11266 [Cladophialophora bantiana CBS 173.52]|uniref:Uncharacterized protein n=1 Tax=Cladophialophora bantiana (strain ATCC 10958 / CBS 173.52 / CDC B-1940 / NIH 8579) TaxID=1442370 RepID=A0A0D2HB68_CLAB1|nr:uncharacterized protein Z519_11266 [Cladophialophora bantiana CBS 173.52]KIW88155.1 hypothetical protein Z519_11266 [Cladophialophora bantiana CBS 173.52]